MPPAEAPGLTAHRRTRRGGFHIRPFPTGRALIWRLLSPADREDIGRFPGNPPPILFCLDKRKCAAAGGRENRRVPNLAQNAQGLANTGVERIGPAEVGSPADPAPDPGSRKTPEPHRRCGGWTWAENESASFSFRCRLPGVGREPGCGPIWNRPLRLKEKAVSHRRDGGRILHPPLHPAENPALPAGAARNARR